MSVHGIRCCVCVCLCNRPTALAMCSNNEVEVFQNCTRTALRSGSVASYNFILALPPHLIQPFFWIFLFLSSILPPPQSISVCCRITSLCCTRSPSPLPARNSVHLDVVHTRHHPASAAQLCALRRMPASATFYRFRLYP